MADVLELLKEIEEIGAAEEDLWCLSGALDLTTDAIGMADLDGKLFYHNKAFIELFGYGGDELSVAGGLSAVYEDPAVVGNVLDTIVTGESWSGEVGMINRSGHKLDVLLRASCIKNEENEITGLLGIHTDITKNNREEELRQSEQQYRSIFEAMSDGLFVSSPDGIIKEVNSAGAKMHGYLANELVGKHGSVLVHSDCLKLFGHGFEAVSKGNVFCVEAQDVRKDGTIFDVDIRGVPFEMHGQPHVLGIVRDISEQKKAQRELAQSEEKFKMLVTNSEEIIYMIARDGTVLLSEGKGLIKLGLKPGQVVGENVFEMYKGFPDILSAFKRAFAGETVVAEQQLGDAYFRSWYTPHRDSDGEIIGLLGLSMNITSQKLVEQELRLKNIVFESSIAANSIADTHGIIHTVNSAFVKMWGYTEEDAVGKSVGDFFVHQEEIAAILKDLKTVGKWEGEALAKRRDGTEFVTRGLATIVINEKGEFIGYQSTCLDVTAQRMAEAELKKTLEALRQSNKDLEQFAYVASHDLQEPLRMIGSYVQLLKKRYADKLDDNANEFIMYAVDGANRMKQQIEDLLAFSRIGTSGNSLARCESEVAVDRAMANLKLAIERSGACVTREALPCVHADEGQLIQLFQNLIGNGIKFSTNGTPKVHIQAKRDKNEWIFSVKDNGIGIEPDYFERIFVIFQRLHTKAEFGGTGIGLALCKKIIERHDGRLWVDSTPNVGSTFYFSLPIKGGI